MRLVDADEMRENLEWCKSQSGQYNDIYWDDVIERLDVQPTVDAIPIEPLAAWLTGYRVKPPRYAMEAMGLVAPIDPGSVVWTIDQIASAWSYHLRKLCESGLMGNTVTRAEND